MAQGREVEVKFRRDLGLLEITMIGLGPTIGTTIFLLVGPGFAITGPSLVLAFGLNFVVTMFTAMAYMELGSAFPETGGGYLWIRRSMRDPWGFLGGWMSWFGHCIVASFYIYGFGFGLVLAVKTILNAPSLALYGLDEGALTKLFAVLAAGVFIVLNYRGTKLTGRSETAVTIALVAVVISFIIAGLLYLTHAGVPAANFQPFLRGGTDGQQQCDRGDRGAGHAVRYPDRRVGRDVGSSRRSQLSDLLFEPCRVRDGSGRRATPRPREAPCSKAHSTHFDCHLGPHHRVHHADPRSQ